MSLEYIRANNEHSLSTPHFISKTFLDFITQPIDSDNDWIRAVKQDSWKGFWIDPTIRSLKRMEETAADKDLVILYIHGKSFLSY